MDSQPISLVGLSRLRLPVPAAKLAIVHAASELLLDETEGSAFWALYLDRLQDLELESEVVEVLCIAVLAKQSVNVSATQLQLAVKRPSPLSDLCLGQISGRTPIVNTWRHCHFGEAPAAFVKRDDLDELRDSRIIPPILWNRLSALQRSSGKPLLAQWAWEFRGVLDRIGEASSGWWQYFAGDDRRHAVGQFITRRSHAARSAYLRVLAAAFDLWGMPLEQAYDLAMYATPADFALLPLCPGPPPDWATPIHASEPISENDCRTLITKVLDMTLAATPPQTLLHTNVPLRTTETYAGELEVIACLAADWVSITDKEAFVSSESLLGAIEVPRSADGSISIPQRTTNELIADRVSGVAPAVLPLFGRHVGYFHSDLVYRMPYVPANFSTQGAMAVRSAPGGCEIGLGTKPCGWLKFWNVAWNPTHNKDLGTPCGISLTVDSAREGQVFETSGMVLKHFWRAKILKRDKNYEDWTASSFSGPAHSS